MHIVDRTTHSAPRDRTQDGRTICRRGRHQTIGQVRGAFLHQTGFVNGNIGRYDPIIAHFVVMRSGTVLQIRDATTVLNSVSAGRAVDIEFEGSYASVRQIRRGGSALHPPLAQIMGGRALLQHLKHRLGIDHVWAHRQASRMQRDNCPGPQLWYNVGEWGIQTCGLSSAGVRDPIPDEWRDPDLDLVWSSPLPPPTSDADFDRMVSGLAGR